jgi:methionyl-tRNA synthetase
VLCKREEDRPRLATVMYVLAECIRAIAVYIQPTMPSTPARIYAQLGVTDPELMTWDSVKAFGALKPGTVVKKGEALFPRVDIRKELEAMAAGKDKAERPRTRARRRTTRPRRRKKRRKRRRPATASPRLTTL